MMFSDKETDYLGSQPLARIATASAWIVQPDVAPVGFDFDGTFFYISGYNVENTLKYKNVLSNPKVALVVDDLVSIDPWTPRGIKIHGVASFTSREGYVGSAEYIPDRAEEEVELGNREPQPGRRIMILLKSCPRCHGDMLLEELPGEVEIVCLQCGHRAYPEAQTGQPLAPVSIAKEAA